jgi:hypothetical protein
MKKGKREEWGINGRPLMDTVGIDRTSRDSRRRFASQLSSIPSKLKRPQVFSYLTVFITY